MLVFPSLTGIYNVGTKDYHWIDQERAEYYGPNKSGKRELIVKVWYPSGKGELNKFQYVPKIIAPWKKGLHASGFSADHIHELDEIYTHAMPDAHIYNKSFPVIIVSHGYVAFHTAYTAYCEELASQGYIIVSVGHTYYTQLAIFPDERTISALPEHWHQTKLLNEESRLKEQELWLLDLHFVLDKLEKENKDQNSFLCDKLDLLKVGAFGHSFGGSTAVELCRTDHRCKAVVDLDGGLFMRHPTKPFNKAMMAIVGKISWDRYNLNKDEEIASYYGFPVQLISLLREIYIKAIPQLLKNLGHDAYFVVIQGADHAAFSDWILLKQMAIYVKNKHIFDLEKITGVIDGERINMIVNAYLVAFFDKYLKGKDSLLLKDINAFDEAKITIYS